MSRKRWFVDTGYWLALFNTGDRHHQRARRLAVTIPGPFVTTESVLQEVGNSLSKPPQRLKAVTVVEAACGDENIEVVSVVNDLFKRGFERYKGRGDKGWGLTDCISFVVMEDRGMNDALSNDVHFQQAGFRALLLDQA